MVQNASYTVSVIIVTYNSAREIHHCLRSLLHALSTLSAEVIIVDNNSADSTVAAIVSLQGEFTARKIELRITQNPGNRGFTRATNQGLQQARGEFLLLMNPDIEVRVHTITSLIAFLGENERAGAAAPQLRNPNGSIQPSCRRFPRGRDLLFELSGAAKVLRGSAYFNRWKMPDFDHATMTEVEQPQGAFLLIRRTAFEQVGFLDERFEMFFSDVDWCRRLRDSGMRIFFYPHAEALHYKGASVYRNRARMIILSHRDFVRYFEKYPGDALLPHWLIILMLLITAWPRILVEAVRKELKGQYAGSDVSRGA